jgi:hypothetical protein
VATPELEAQLLELARHSTAAQLERVLRAYRGVLARDLAPEELAHGERYLTCAHDDDGGLVIRGRLPAEEGALLMAALDAGRDQLRSEASGEGGAEAGLGVAAAHDSAASIWDQPRAPTPSNPDALLLMADTLLASGPAQRNGGDRYQVMVHVDIDALSGAGDAEGAKSVQDAKDSDVCRLDHGEALEPETARRLACDASVVSLVERAGRPLSVGRKTRSVPPALRRALASRDQACRFPGCSQTRFPHAHHIDHWARGGPTELANLVHLCGHHHRLLHEGGYGLIRGPHRTLRFTRPDGTTIPAVPEVAVGSRQRLRAENRGHGLAITPNTTARHWDGSRLELPLAIDALVASDTRLEEAHH